MQLALPVGPRVRTRTVEVRRDRDPKLPEPTRQGKTLPEQEPLLEIDLLLRRVKRPRQAVAGRQEQPDPAERRSRVDGIVCSPHIQLSDRVAPNGLRIR